MHIINVTTHQISTDRGWPSGSFPDRTRRVNFHSSSTERYTKIFEFNATCAINAVNTGPTGSGLPPGHIITINDSPDPNLVFPPSLMNMVTAELPNGNREPVYHIPQVWVYVADLRLPYLITEFIDNKNAYADTRQLAQGIPPSYGPDGQTMIYECKFVAVGISPMFYGTWVGGVTRENNGTYSATVISKFEVTSFGGVTPQPPTLTYLRLQYRNSSTDGKWIDINAPDVIGAVNGLMEGGVDQNGYIHFIVRSLQPDTEYTLYVTRVEPGSNFHTLLKGGDTSSVFFENARTALPQPMIPARFKTPPASDSTKKIRFFTGSCVDGTMEAIAGSQFIDFDFAVWNGDNYYQDNGDDYQDFIRRYDSLFRNFYYWHTVINQGNYYLADDHEVQDNWDTRIQFTADNANNFLITPTENTIYTNTNNIPEFRPYIIWTRSGGSGVQPVQLSSKERVLQAYQAFDTALPTMPYNKDHISRNYSETWGQA